MNLRDHQILHIALPAIITNITIPLLGLVDTAIVGHMGDAVYIAAIAVGSMMFNLIYWIFGFLRMGTCGLTAQARGRCDRRDIKTQLTRSLLISSFIALTLLLGQWPLCEFMLWLIGPTAEVRPLASTYFYIVIWGAPASLGLFSLTGWYIGMQNTRFTMLISIFQNIINILASLTLVYGFGMKVEGVAMGTVIAQYAGLITGLSLLWRYYRKTLQKNPNRQSTKSDTSFEKFFRINRDIFLRTLFLVAVNLYFTSAGARQGATILAVNTLLMQLYLLFSYIMDGFAFAGEALGGRYWGAKDSKAFHEVVKRLFGWGATMTALFTLLYIVCGMPFLHLLTDEPTVAEASRTYIWWAYLIPICGVAAFIWDGIFIGITKARGMLLATATAAGVFFCVIKVTIASWGNHSLWLAMVLFLLVRGIVQTVIYWQRYKIILN